MMGGLDWAALDTVVNVIGVTDVEALLVRLVTIRDLKNDNGISAWAPTIKK